MIHTKVTTEDRGAVRILRINRPEQRNCVDGETAVGIGARDRGVRGRRARARARRDRRGRAGVLRRRGPEERRSSLFQHEYLDTAGPMGFARLDPGKPTIAAINGYCFAGGGELAAWCDIRIGAANAEFGCLSRRWGVPYTDGGTQRFAAHHGHRQRALHADDGRALRRAARLRDGLPAGGRAARARRWRARSSWRRRSRPIPNFAGICADRRAAAARPVARARRGTAARGRAWCGPRASPTSCATASRASPPARATHRRDRPRLPDRGARRAVDEHDDDGLPTTPTVVQRILDHIDQQDHRSRREHLARAGRELSLRGALRGRAASCCARTPTRVLSVGGARRSPASTSRATPPARRSSRCAGSDGTVPRLPQRLPPPRHAARRRQRLRAGVRLPLPRLDLRPRREPAPRAARARLPRARQARARPGAGRELPSATASCSSRRTRPALAERGARRAPDARSPPATGCSAATSARSPANWKIVCRGLPRGLPHPLDPPGDVLSAPVRQPERRRDVRPQQPHRVPLPRHQEAARGTPLGGALARTASSPTSTTCSRTSWSRPSRAASSWSCSSRWRLDRTRFVTYLSARRPRRRRRLRRAARRSQRASDLVDAGAAEDREVACAIQRSLASGANEFFEFGLLRGRDRPLPSHARRPRSRSAR